MHPVVVPRVKRLGESVDEHQLTFGRRLGELGLATVVEDVSELGRAVRTVPESQPRTGLSPQLADELLAYVGSVRARREGYESG
jgi:UDP-N-acetylglucosamine transferase subunit ALG13